jgi:ATP-dependent helicase/nuclease subunit B
VEEWRGPFDAAAEQRLLEIGGAAFTAVAHFPEVHAIWWLRFQAIARWLIGWEAARNEDVAARFAEVSGRMEFAAPLGPFALRGRADRIDLRQDGRIDIFDFKTGSPPTAKQVLSGFSPQLALEVAMARAGAFDAELAKSNGAPVAGRGVATLAWLGLSGVRRGEVEKSAVERGWTADAVGAEASARLKALVAAYDDEQKGYLSLARPMLERQRFPGDYDHLARVE